MTEGFLPRLNKVLLILIVLTAVIPLTYHALPGRSEKVSQDKMIAEAEADLADAYMMKDRLSSEVTLLENDGEYRGMFARDRVDRGYMAKDETIFRLIPRKQ